MALVSYFQLYFPCDFARFVKTSINVSGSSWLSEWDGRDVKFLDESVVDEVFCGSAVH